MSVRVLLEVPVTFDVGGEVIHAPMIEVDVGGTMTKLIVDTGSTDHVLTMELAERAGLEASPGEPGTDSVGASVSSWTLGEVPVRIGDIDIRLQNVVAIAGPEPFEGWGIGGFLSPQHVHPNAWVVIDLVDGALTFVGGEEADVVAWVADRFPTLQTLSLERESGDSTVLVRAAIEPLDPVVTMLDTGGKRTEFAEDAVPTPLGGIPAESGRGVGGATAIGSEVKNQVLRVGDARLPVPRLLVRKEIGVAQGLVGMDLLRGTVLVASADPSRPVLWLVPRVRGRGATREGHALESGMALGQSCRGRVRRVDDASVLTILVVAGLALGLGGSMVAVLARTERFEGQQWWMEQVARQAGRAGLAILVIVAVIVAVFLIRELFTGSP